MGGDTSLKVAPKTKGRIDKGSDVPHFYSADYDSAFRIKTSAGNYIIYDKYNYAYLKQEGSKTKTYKNKFKHAHAIQEGSKTKTINQVKIEGNNELTLSVDKNGRPELDRL
jgi:hypothetical protein